MQSLYIAVAEPVIAKGLFHHINHIAWSSCLSNLQCCNLHVAKSRNQSLHELTKREKEDKRETYVQITDLERGTSMKPETCWLPQLQAHLDDLVLKF